MPHPRLLIVRGLQAKRGEDGIRGQLVADYSVLHLDWTENTFLLILKLFCKLLGFEGNLTLRKGSVGCGGGLLYFTFRLDDLGRRR